MTRLRPATPSELDSCLAFLAPREFRCVGLSSRLNRPGEGTLWVLGNPEHGYGDIAALFLKTPGGMLFHCVREGFDLAQAKSQIVRNLFADFPSTVIGSLDATCMLETMADVKPRYVVDYDLLTLKSEPKGGNARREEPGLSVSRAGPERLEALLPLQEGYEREEVLLPGEPFRIDRCRAMLKATLSSQRVYAAWIGSLPVAKAGTNAQGIAWDQIGGVYTAKDYRGKGYARSVFRELCLDRIGKRKNIALFVKKNNFSAKNLYFSEGFTFQEGFRIIYW